MPRLIILAVTLLSAFSLIAGPKATWLSDSHDFGAFDEDLSTVTCPVSYTHLRAHET